MFFIEIGNILNTYIDEPYRFENIDNADESSLLLHMLSIPSVHWKISGKKALEAYTSALGVDRHLLYLKTHKTAR